MKKLLEMTDEEFDDFIQSAKDEEEIRYYLWQDGYYDD